MRANSLYGCYRQVKFTDVHADDFESSKAVWNNADTFLADWKNTFYYTSHQTDDPAYIEDDSIKLTYYLLCSRFANSVLASSDENRFKLQVFTTIYQYLPTVVKKAKMQDDLRALTISDAAETKQIHNHALNPQTFPVSTMTGSDELSFINEQTVSTTKRNEVDAAAKLWTMLATDVYEEFINRFQHLFINVVVPDAPLWYVSDGGEEDDE